VEKVGSRMSVSEEHIGNQYRYSLRVSLGLKLASNCGEGIIHYLRCPLQVYLSILYLQIPQNFCIMLRGKVVQHHNIAQDLKFPEFILYKPQTGGTKEVTSFIF